MKKSISVSATALVLESCLLFSMPNLTDWQKGMLWCGIGVIAVLMCVTAYVLFSKIVNWKEEQNQSNILQNQEFQDSSSQQLKELSEIIGKMQANHEAQLKLISESQKNLISETTEVFTSKIGDMQQQLLQSATHNDKIQETTQELYKASIQQLQESQQLQSEKLTESQKSMISEITEVFTSKIDDMQQQFLQSANHNDKIQKATQELYKDSIEQLIEKLQQHFQMQIEELIKSNADSLYATETQITEWNKKLLENQNANFDTITNEIGEIYKQHITIVSTRIQQSFAEFANETTNILSQHIQQTEILADTERKFIDEFSECQSKYQTELQHLISQNASDYTQAANNISNQLNEKIQTVFMQTSKENVCQIQKLTEFQKSSINMLSEQLAGFTNSLVQKSAEAIAEVQSDNNKKLQQAAGDIALLAKTTEKFIQDSLGNIENIKDKINFLMQKHDEFLSCIEKTETDNINNISRVMQEKLKNLADTIHMLNTEQVELFNNTMQDYREKFVEANAAALATVQSDATQVISEAHKKIGDLSEKISETENQIQQMSNELLEMSEAIHSAIEDGNENLEEIIEVKLEDYNDTFKKMKKTINDVYDNIQSNTEQYQSMFEEIQKMQKDMNSLTEQDIHILEELLKQ